MYHKQIEKKTSSSLSSTPINKKTIPTPRSGSLSGVIQRAVTNPESLSQEEWLGLDSSIGTRATEEIQSGKGTSWVPEFQGISAQLWGDSGGVSEPIQRKEKDDVGLSKVGSENKTGLPDNLKAGVESLSGYSFDDVRVHYNSPKPLQLQAHAYAQGTDIHVAPGQDEHLPHEAWHVVQQMQGRVKPTMQLKGLGVNDDSSLEYEADVKGKQASLLGSNKNNGSQSDRFENSNIHTNNLTINDTPISTTESANGSLTIQQQGKKNTVVQLGRAGDIGEEMGNPYIIELILFGPGEDFWKTWPEVIKASGMLRLTHLDSYTTIWESRKNNRLTLTVAGGPGPSTTGGVKAWTGIKGASDTGSNSIEAYRTRILNDIFNKIPEHIKTTVKKVRANQPTNQPILILIKAHSRNAVARTQIAKELQEFDRYWDDNNVKIEFVAFDLVPGQNKDIPVPKIKGAKEELKSSKFIMGKGKNKTDESTVESRFNTHEEKEEKIKGFEKAKKKISQAPEEARKEAFNVLMKEGFFESVEARKEEHVGTDQLLIRSGVFSETKDNKYGSEKSQEVYKGARLKVTSTQEFNQEVIDVINNILLMAKLDIEIGWGFVDKNQQTSHQGDYKTRFERELALSANLLKVKVKEGQLQLSFVNGLLFSRSFEAQIGLSGSASFDHQITGEHFGLQGKVEVAGIIGAEAKAKGKLMVNKQDISAAGKLEAFIGAKVTPKVSGAITDSRGKPLVSASLGVPLSAGIGGALEGKVGYEHGQVTIGGEVSGTVFLGAGVKGNIGFDISAIKSSLKAYLSSSKPKLPTSDEDEKRPNIAEDRKEEMKKELYDGFFNSIYQYAFKKAKDYTSGNSISYAKKDRVQQIIAEAVWNNDQLAELILYQESDYELAKIVCDATGKAAEDAKFPNLKESQSSFGIKRGIIYKWPYRNIREENLMPPLSEYGSLSDSDIITRVNVFG
ncbi:DUF4157 domain-containing protein [Dapis sp. BLCC M229]|uniref:eCIS core domain-containing protein n=1 Tax=Dapis sp. BLCC M229 TaxID=3400188 RepID=UPI003CEF348D